LHPLSGILFALALIATDALDKRRDGDDSLDEEAVPNSATLFSSHNYRLVSSKTHMSQIQVFTRALLLCSKTIQQNPENICHDCPHGDKRLAQHFI
jgi:hypothetical protein